MKKLTPAQIQAVANRKGLLEDAGMWESCIRFLYLQIADSDPSGTEQWTLAMSRVKAFVDWALSMASTRYNGRARSYLELASRHNMSPERHHELFKVRCGFSGRKKPMGYYTTNPNKATPVAIRVQRHFTWWAYHAESGMMCPHRSADFVYESSYSHLLNGIHLLGHLPQLLRQEAGHLHVDLKWDDFKALPKWTTLYEIIRDAMYVVSAILNA